MWAEFQSCMPGLVRPSHDVEVRRQPHERVERELHKPNSLESIGEMSANAHTTPPVDKGFEQP